MVEKLLAATAVLSGHHGVARCFCPVNPSNHGCMGVEQNARRHYVLVLEKAQPHLRG
jgi:hypothetical protein